MMEQNNLLWKITNLRLGGSWRLWNGICIENTQGL